MNQESCVTSVTKSTETVEKYILKKSLEGEADFDALLRQMADKKEKTWTLRPSKELQAAIAEAIKATGSPRQKLIFECIRRELPGVVLRIERERKVAMKSFGKNKGGKGKK